MLFAPHLAFTADAAAGSGPSSSSSTLPPPSAHLVITDTLTAKADVALFHLVIAAIQQSIPIIWLDLRSETQSSWEAILRRLGTPLPKDPKLFTRIAPSPLPGTVPLFADGEPSLFPTYEAVINALPEGRSLLLLDGLSELTAIGFEPVAVARFVRAILSKAGERGATVVSTLHADGLDSAGSVKWDENELLDRLLRLGGGWWRVEGLSTGRSADVSGEISAFALEPRMAGAGMPSIPKDKALQFRLEVGGVKVFAKGTGRGYL